MTRVERIKHAGTTDTAALPSPSSDLSSSATADSSADWRKSATPSLNEHAAISDKKMRKKVRMTLEFSAQLNETIEALARKLDLTSKTDVIKRAISLLALVVARRERDTQHLALVDEEGKVVTFIAFM